MLTYICISTVAAMGATAGNIWQHFPLTVHHRILRLHTARDQLHCIQHLMTELLAGHTCAEDGVAGVLLPKSDPKKPPLLPAAAASAPPLGEGIAMPGVPGIPAWTRVECKPASAIAVRIHYMSAIGAPLTNSSCYKLQNWATTMLCIPCKSAWCDRRRIWSITA